MPAEPPIARFLYSLGDKIALKAMEDPLSFLVQLETITTVGMKFLPVLPGEYPYPIPRGIYDILVKKR